MGECGFCDREMTEADTCTKNAIAYSDARWFWAIPYGDETRYDDVADDYDVERPDRCHDCGVTPGGTHHPGCDWEESPRTGQQLLAEVIREQAEAAPRHARIVVDDHADISWQDIAGGGPSGGDPDA